MATYLVIAASAGLRLKQPTVELTLASQLLIINLGVGGDGFKRATHRGCYFFHVPDRAHALQRQ